MEDTRSRARRLPARSESRGGRHRALAGISLVLFLVGLPCAPSQAEPMTTAHAVAVAEGQIQSEEYAKAETSLRSDWLVRRVRAEPQRFHEFLRGLVDTTLTWRTTRRTPDAALPAIVAARELAELVRQDQADDPARIFMAGLAFYAEAMTRYGMFERSVMSDASGGMLEASRQADAYLAEGAVGLPSGRHDALIYTAGLLRRQSELVSHAGLGASDALRLLDEADKLDPRGSRTVPERLRCLAAEVRYAAERKDMTAAKGHVAAALDLLGEADMNGLADPVAGAWNHVYMAAKAARLTDKRLAMATKPYRTRPLVVHAPRGMDWRDEERPLLDAGTTLLSRSRVGTSGGTVRLQLSSFAWETSYGGASGASPKAIHEVVSTLARRQLPLDDAKSAGRSPLPRWASGARGSCHAQVASLGHESWIWIWVFKGKASRRTFLACVHLDEADDKEIPADILDMLGSMEEVDR